MPNIEIHGFPQKEAEDLKDKVFELFEDRPYVDEMVVTIYPTVVKDKHGNDQPFIRLANSHRLLSQDLLERLRTLGMDIEHLKLEAFYLKGKPT